MKCKSTRLIKLSYNNRERSSSVRKLVEKAIPIIKKYEEENIRNGYGNNIYSLLNVESWNGFSRSFRGILMNETKTRFMENSVVNQSYYEQPNPYVNAPSCHVNLLELSRYAKKCGKKLAEFTQEEVKNFQFSNGGHIYRHLLYHFLFIRIQ